MVAKVLTYLFMYIPVTLYAESGSFFRHIYLLDRVNINTTSLSPFLFFVYIFVGVFIIYPLKYPVLLWGFAAAPGSLQYAIRNHDLLALKILLTAMSPENVLSETEQDEFGRSPLELARVAQEMAFDNLVGHLESYLSESGLEFSSASDVVGTSSSGSEGSKKRRRTANKEQADTRNNINGPGKYGGRGGTFFEKAGTDVQIDCSVDVVESSELSKEQFLRDYVIPGRPLFIKGAVDHWDLSTYKLSTFPDELGDVEVAANQVLLAHLLMHLTYVVLILN